MHGVLMPGHQRNITEGRQMEATMALTQSAGENEPREIPWGTKKRISGHELSDLSTTSKLFRYLRTDASKEKTRKLPSSTKPKQNNTRRIPKSNHASLSSLRLFSFAPSPEEGGARLAPAGMRRTPINGTGVLPLFRQRRSRVALF